MTPVFPYTGVSHSCNLQTACHCADLTLAISKKYWKPIHVYMSTSQIQFSLGLITDLVRWEITGWREPDSL
jgi:hypothetical protein